MNPERLTEDEVLQLLSGTPSERARAQNELRRLLRGSAQECALSLKVIDRVFRYRIPAIIRWQLPSLRPDDLPDIWQETLIGVYQSRTLLAEQGNLVSWLIKIAYRKTVSFLRKERPPLSIHENPSETSEADSPVDQLVAADRCDDIKRLEDEEEAEHLRKLIDDFILKRLSPLQRSLIQTRRGLFRSSDSNNITVQDILNALGDPNINARQVKENLLNARNALQLYLLRKGFSVKRRPDHAN